MPSLLGERHAFGRDVPGGVPFAESVRRYVSLAPLPRRAGAKPERLTAFDLAYLESLYEGLPNLPAQSKIADVKARMQSQRADRE